MEQTIEELLKSPSKLKKFVEEYITCQTVDFAIMHSKRKLYEGILAILPEYLEYIHLLFEKAKRSTDEQTKKLYLGKIASNWEHHKRYGMPWPTKREQTEKPYDKQTMEEVVNEEISFMNKNTIKTMFITLSNKERDVKKVEKRLETVKAKESEVIEFMNNLQTMCIKAKKANNTKFEEIMCSIQEMFSEYLNLDCNSNAQV